MFAYTYRLSHSPLLTLAAFLRLASLSSERYIFFVVDPNAFYPYEWAHVNIPLNVGIFHKNQMSQRQYAPNYTISLHLSMRSTSLIAFILLIIILHATPISTTWYYAQCCQVLERMCVCVCGMSGVRQTLYILSGCVSYAQCIPQVVGRRLRWLKLVRWVPACVRACESEYAYVNSILIR